MKAFQYNARFIELAADINTNMPRYVVSRVMDAFNERGTTLKGSKCLVLGAAYKPDIDDIRESPASGCDRTAPKERGAGGVP